MSKVLAPHDAAAFTPNGATVMFGGFMGCGIVHKIIDALAKSNVRDVSMIC